MKDVIRVKLQQGLAYIFCEITTLFPLIHCNILVKGVKGVGDGGQSCSLSFFCQGRLQRETAEFHSGEILAHKGRSAQRKIIFKVPEFCVLCSVLWESPDLKHLLQECPDRNLIISPTAEMLCSPEMVMVWKVKEKGIAWKHPFLEGLLQALRNKLGSA